MSKCNVTNCSPQSIRNKLKILLSTIWFNTCFGLIETLNSVFILNISIYNEDVLYITHKNVPKSEVFPEKQEIHYVRYNPAFYTKSIQKKCG